MTNKKTLDKLDYIYKLLAVLALLITATILAKDIVIPILISAFLSVILHPVVTWFQKKLSLTLSVIVVLLMTLLIFSGALWIIGDQLTHLVQDLPNLENKFNNLVDNVSNQIRSLLGMSRAEQNQMEREFLRRPVRMSPTCW
jgi:predicted PurR-regulated permease PerM